MPTLLSSTLRPHTEARFEEDWTRQQRAAEDILRRLRNQEGVILADQVGMGKTYVALAVAVSQILATTEPGQVVIFVPPTLADKWVREWKKFSETLLEPGTGIRCVEQPLRSSEDFLKALDDPPDRRNHVVVVTHSALTNDVKDTFVQLALLYYATRYQRDGEDLRRRIAKWSSGNSGLVRDHRFTEERVARILASRPQDWREVWRRMPGCNDLGDEPVPQQIIDAVDPANFGALRQVIRSLPVNRTANIKTRIAAARRELKDALSEAWKQSLASIQQDLPLLIVDEAHRLKNSSTHVSKLFAERSTADKKGGVFTGLFRRMLFLTATPFELGHTELVNVLSRMTAVRNVDPPPRQTLPDRLDALSKVLAAAQANAITFDTAWGRLKADDLQAFGQWTPTAPAPPGLGTAPREAWEHARLAVQARHELHAALRPWVIRHERPHRRTYYPGNAILADDKRPAGGLDIPEAAALPFLLAARAQSVALDESGPARPLFAYGIASSYDAFGRLGSGHADEGRDSDMPNEDRERAPAAKVSHGATADAVRWYRKEIDRALADRDVRAAHPKVRATVDKTSQMWAAGEKCLTFCWFIKTSEALEQALATRIDRLILERASASLSTGRDDDTRAELEHIAERLFRRDSSSYERIRDKLSRALQTNAGGHEDVLDLVVDAAIRHLRTPSYLVRYTPLTPQIDADDVWAGIHGDNPGRLVLLKKWRQFAERLAQARDQIEASDPSDEHDSEFARFNAALLGARNEDDQTVRRGASLHPVRRASGQTDRHVRERLIALFNTPFSPDLLVASSVMGEGIDLHQECRFVIHHDLDWNPSVLEQRTGRLDRIGALAERENKPIEVYEPYLAGTHDEKMFRVVKDRAGWFDIVMGRASSADEHVTDTEEVRIPLPGTIRAALTMDLRSPGAA